jgi:hypothetical protein
VEFDIAGCFSHRSGPETSRPLSDRNKVDIKFLFQSLS